MEGDYTENINLRYLNKRVLKAKEDGLFTRRQNLQKEFRKLIGKELVRIRIMGVNIEGNKLYVRVYLLKQKFSGRRKQSTSLYKNGVYRFTYVFNSDTNSYEFLKLESGTL